MSFRFVHTADIHLDSPLKSLAMRDPQLAELVGTASRTSLMSIIDLCLDEQVDALLIAGDLYDGDQTSMKTARFLMEQIRRLHEAGIRTFIIRGNHDAESKITNELTFPDSVKVFTAKAEALDLKHGPSDVPIVVHGLSFRDRHAPDSLVRKYKPMVEGSINIGLMHTSLGGTEGHDIYAPCSIRDLTETGFNYWALGHIHKRSVELGRTTIVMPGIPQGRDINESGPKSVTLVTVKDDRSITLEEKFTSVVEFARVPVKLDGVSEWREALFQTHTALEEKRAQSTTDHFVARIQISGSTPLSWRMRRDGDLLKAEADDMGGRVGRCWIDKVENATTEVRQASSSSDPLVELRGLILDRVLGSPGYQQNLVEMMESLNKQLPSELRSIFGNDAESQKSRLETLVREGSEEVLARLSGQSAEGP